MSNYPTNTDESDFMQALLENDEEVKQVVTEKKETAIINSENNEAMQALLENAELAMLFNKNADLGSEELDGGRAQLKIHTTNKSKGHVLFNGEEPNNGWLFDTGTQQQYQTVDAHVLAVSRGFKAKGMEEEGIDAGLKFNQVMMIVLLQDDGSLSDPLLVYLSGGKLNNLWEFGKEAKKFTKARPQAIPLFALLTKIGVEKWTHDFGSSFRFTFNLQYNELGHPLMVKNMEIAKELASGAERATKILKDLADSKDAHLDEPVRLESEPF